MTTRLQRASKAITVCLLFAGPAAADSDASWVTASIGQGVSAAPASVTKVVARRRSVESISGLARIDDDKPRRSSGGEACVPSQLATVLADVEAKFGAVKITSTCRSASANRAAGGAPQSLHLSGQAVDFRVAGSTGAVMAFLQSHSGVGGLKHYGGGLFHIDTGDRRPF